MTLEHMSDQELAALIRECVKTGKSVDAALKGDMFEVGDYVDFGLANGPVMKIEAIMNASRTSVQCLYFTDDRQVVRLTTNVKALRKRS